MFSYLIPTFNLYFGSNNFRGVSLSFLLSDLSIGMIYFLFGGTLGSHILSHDRVMNSVGLGGVLDLSFLFFFNVMMYPVNSCTTIFATTVGYWDV